MTTVRALRSSLTIQITILLLFDESPVNSFKPYVRRLCLELSKSSINTNTIEKGRTYNLRFDFNFYRFRFEKHEFNRRDKHVRRCTLCLT